MSNNPEEKYLSLEEFLEIPLEFIKINCGDYIQRALSSNVYCVELLINYSDISISNIYLSHRNYSEFKDLFETFTKKNPTEKFPEFPGRLTFFKEEARIKYFNMFLNRILELAKNGNNKKENMEYLYNFIFGFKDAIINKLTDEKIKEIFNKDSGESNTDEGDTNSVKSENIKNIKNGDIPNKKKLNKTASCDKLSFNLPLNEEDKESKDSKDSKDSKSIENEDNKSIDNNINFNYIKRNTINYMNKKFNFFFGEKEPDIKNLIKGIKRTISIDEKDKESLVEDNSNSWENLLVKTTLKDYSLHTIKIKERCLQFFSDETEIFDNIEEKIIIENNKDKEENYYLMIPLYKINIEIYRIIYQPILKNRDKNNTNNNEKNKQNENDQSNNEKYDTDSEKNDSKDFNKYMDDITYVKKKTKFISSSEIYQFESYAPNALLSDVNSEIEIHLYHDYDFFETFIKFDMNWRIRSVKNFLSKIEQSSYSNKTKSLYIDDITESYMDSFGNIMVDIISFKAPYFEGKIKIKVSLEPYLMPTRTIMSEKVFNFNQKFILPKHNRFKYLRFFVYKIKEEGLIIKKDTEKLIASYEIALPKLLNTYFITKDKIEVKLKPTKEKSKKKQKYLNMSLEYKFYDYSTLLSLLVKNTNKRVLDDYPLFNKEGDSEEPYTISTLLKRIKRVLAMFKDIYNFYKMLQNFKYPVLSSFFLLLVIFYTFFCEPRFILTHILVLLISILVYYSSVFNIYIYPKLCPIFFHFRNKYDTPSTIACTESQKNKAEVAQNDYLIKKKTGFYIPSFKEIKEYKSAYIDLLFRLSRIASFFEKFKNLFIWTDPLLSFYMIALLIFILLIVWNIELRYITCFSIVKKFIFGIFFYKNKLINNKEIARIIVTDAYNIWKKEKEKEDKEEKKTEVGVIKTMEKRGLDDEKLKNTIKTKLYEHSNIILNDKFYDNMETIGDVIEELGKIDDVLKIKRLSYLFHLTKNNSKIYRKDIDPEDIFAFFLQNIKSDYYRASNGFIKTDYFQNEGIIGDDLQIKNKERDDKKRKTISYNISNVDINKTTEEK